MSEKTESAVTKAELDGLIQWHVDQISVAGDGSAKTANTLRSLREQVLAQAKEIERKDKALRFYADTKNWQTAYWEDGTYTDAAIPITHEPDGGTPCDCGDTARAALSPAAQEAPASQVICGCGACSDTIRHSSDCAVHNLPAMPAGPCDCGVSVAASSPGLREAVVELLELRDRTEGTYEAAYQMVFKHPANDLWNRVAALASPAPKES